jgi:RecA-family ATPase
MIGTAEDLRDLLDEELPPQRWALGGYIERPGHLVVAGRAGTGKTMLAMQLAIQASSPTVPFDLGLDAAPGRVALVDGEMGRRRYHRRIHDLGLAPYVAAGQITYIGGGGLDLVSPDDRAWLMTALAGHDIIVFDSLKKLTRRLSENDNDEMGAVVADLTEMSKTLDAMIITLHHRGTSDKAFRGATAILDQCDAMVTWAKVGDDAESRVRKLSARGEWTKIRDAAEPADRFFEMTDTGLLIPTQAPDPAPRAAPKRDRYVDAILALLPYVGTKSDLAAATGATSTGGVWAQAYEAVAMLDGDARHHVARPMPAI